MPDQHKKFGLIGYPLGHSYSKGHFTRKFVHEGLSGYSYENYEIASIGSIIDIIKKDPDLVGLNVTIPYKQAVMGYLDEIDTIAAEIGAVNTIKITHSGEQVLLNGYNTDIIGFTKSINRWQLEKPVKALVFGSGGSSLAIKYALKNLGISFISVSRKSEAGFIPYQELTEKVAKEYRLWINCTPVGMFPHSDETLPLPYQHLSPEHYLYDLVYNPDITLFLSKGVSCGAHIMNGMAMLYEQAESSWEIWTGEKV
jgi:shikimate dehydrogenase